MKTPLFAILTLTVAAVAMAGETMTPNKAGLYQQRFLQLDVNGDGNLSPKEATLAGMPEDSFFRLDVNGDGLLDQREFVALAADTAPAPEPAAPEAPPPAPAN